MIWFSQIEVSLNHDRRVLVIMFIVFLLLLRVGFGKHPHSNAEICTYVVRGKLTHKDSMGTEETIERGDIQFMVC